MKKSMDVQRRFAQNIHARLDAQAGIQRSRHSAALALGCARGDLRGRAKLSRCIFKVLIPNKGVLGAYFALAIAISLFFDPKSSI